MQGTRCQKGKSSSGSVCHTCSTHSDAKKNWIEAQTSLILQENSLFSQDPAALLRQLYKTQLLKWIRGWTSFNVIWIQMVKCIPRSWVSALLN